MCSNRQKIKPKIIFLNQMAGPLFRELAEDLAEHWSPSVLYTGYSDTIKRGSTPHLSIFATPGYQRANDSQRLMSWFKYFFYVVARVLCHQKSPLLFIVSNPPFLPFIGYILKILRRQPYVVLVYDIHPDILINFGRLSQSGLIVRLWRKFNKLVWENADIVFTIGECMSANLETMFNSKGTRAGHVIVVPNWADSDFIKPVEKIRNSFAIKHHQVDKLTVMYSGNIGATHDIETLVEAAGRLKSDESIHFLIIGGGSKKKIIEQKIHQEHLSNITLLPFQPEEVLPYSLSTGDIAMITLDRGAERLMVPSKTYYAMAAGCALLGVVAGDNELSRIIDNLGSGKKVVPGDVDGMVEAIGTFQKDRKLLAQCRKNARDAVEKFYTRKNTNLYVKTLLSAGF